VTPPIIPTTVYRSKVGWEIWGPAILLFVWIIYLTGGKLQVIVILALIALCMICMVRGTAYTLAEDKLIVKCWPVFYEEIDIRAIHRISDTWNPMSSPAASFFGRIEVYYGRGKTCIISPKNKRAFLNDLLGRNRAILTFECDRSRP